MPDLVPSHCKIPQALVEDVPLFSVLNLTPPLSQFSDNCDTKINKGEYCKSEIKQKMLGILSKSARLCAHETQLLLSLISCHQDGFRLDWKIIDEKHFIYFPLHGSCLTHSEFPAFSLKCLHRPSFLHQ